MLTCDVIPEAWAWTNFKAGDLAKRLEIKERNGDPYLFGAGKMIGQIEEKKEGRAAIGRRAKLMGTMIGMEGHGKIYVEVDEK